ncbi:hypothetical protein ACHAQH_009035, partial [Verticillium albo-atrum]
METAGLAIGILGLVGPSLDARDKVKAYRSFPTDSAVLDAQFEALRLLSERLDRSDKGFDQQTSLVVAELRSQINNIIETNDGVPHIGRAKRPANAPTSSTINQHRTRERAKNVSGPSMDLEHGWPAEIRETLIEIRQALAAAQADTRREMRRWVLGQQPSNERYEDSRRKRLPSTCEWVLTQRAFMDWVSSDLLLGMNKILWIYGRPGCGKTVLCSRIVEHLSAIPDTPVAHFFFSSDHESRDDPYIIMRSWVSQLESHPASQPEVSRLVHQKWMTTQDQVATRATVTQLLHEALHARPGCYLIVDGLDECTALADSSSSVARFLEDVKNAITPATRVLVVSREEPEIRQALRVGAASRVTEYQISSEDVHDDITAFSRSIVDRKLPNKNEDVRESLSKTMTDRCEGQFLWLKMQEESLETDMNSRHLQRVLESTPTGLNHIYERNWAKIENSARRDRAVALLRWAAFALRPLTVGEITEAVLIVEEDEDLLADELPDAVDDDYINKGILKLCAPLLEVRRPGPESAPRTRTVHLAHFTIRQFLMGRLPAGSILQDEALHLSNERVQNTILARSCLWYVQCRKTWQDGANIHGSPFQTALRDYAAASWHAHVKSGLLLEQHPDTMERVLRFMSEAHFCWDAWRKWLDIHDEEEKQEAEDEEVPPGPCYYALKLGLDAVAFCHIRKFGPGRSVNGAGRSVLDLCCAQGNVEFAEMILDAGVDIETKAGTGRTPLYSASRHGQSRLVQTLLERGARVDVMNRYGWTPVNLAADGGHVEVVKQLVANGADFRAADNDGWTTVNYAANNGHLEVVMFLVEKDADITIANNDGWTTVHGAANNNHLDVVKFLVEKGADIMVVDKFGWTPVNAAADNGHLEVVKFLVEKSIDITVANNDGWTPVHAAADNGHLDVVKFLVEKGADIMVASNDGWTPVHGAARNGNLALIKFLVDKGADVMAVTKDGWTAVHGAVRNGHLDVVKFLVDKGADITVVGKDGWTPVNNAAASGHLDIVRFLVENGADIMVANNDVVTPVHAAADNGHLDVVKFLVEKGADIMVASNDGWTPVHGAARNGHLDVVKFLVDKGADIMAVTKDGWTAVHGAVRNGHLDIVKFLVDKGADIMVVTKDGWTPFHAAANDGNLDIVRFLVENGADIMVANNDVVTPVHVAAASGHLDVVKFLVNKGADITVAENDGWTSVNNAAASGHLDVVKFLVEKGADIAVVNKDGWAPVYSAAASGHLEIVKFLVDKGADIMVANGGVVTPAYVAANNGHLDVVKFLVDKGADIIAVDKDGWTSVNNAAANGHLDVVKFLVEKGADIMVANNDGWTPVHGAARNGNLALIKFLVEKGADIMVVDKDDWTPLHVAANNGYLEVVKFLVDKGTDITMVNNDGWTPVHGAANNGHLGMVKTGIAAVETDSRDRDGRTPLLLAAEKGHSAVVQLLTNRKDVDLAAEDACGLTALQLAVFNHHTNVESLLLAKNVPVVSDFYGFEFLFGNNGV